MNNIVTIADFKRAMIPGTFWHCTHRYIGKAAKNAGPCEKSLGLRECVLNNTADFGFKTDRGTSHCQWPKRKQFSTREYGNVIVITQPDFCELVYTQQN